MSMSRFPFGHSPLERDVNVRVLPAEPKLTEAAAPDFGTRTTYA
jgi:hypothetical protein